MSIQPDQTLTATDDVDHTRRARILQAALRTFLAYGFSRTTMDDIARAAGMSRPALYLLFRNKSDIFRAGASELLDQSATDAARALAQDGPFAARMVAAIDHSFVALMRDIVMAPHGSELLDMKTTMAGDLAHAWRSALRAHFASAIAAEAGRRGFDASARGLTPEVLADMLLDGLEGAKYRSPDPAALSATAASLVTVIDLTLQA
jgi:AcrR family transcriptional regulator